MTIQSVEVRGMSSPFYRDILSVQARSARVILPVPPRSTNQVRQTKARQTTTLLSFRAKSRNLVFGWAPSEARTGQRTSRVEVEQLPSLRTAGNWDRRNRVRMDSSGSETRTEGTPARVFLGHRAKIGAFRIP